MDTQHFPTQQEASDAAILLSTDTWNPLTNWKKSSAARTLGMRRAAVASRKASKRSPVHTARKSARNVSASRRTKKASSRSRRSR